MQFSFNTLALLAITGLAAAQDIPSCAKPLIDAATVKACGSSTLLCCACTEANKAAIQAAVAPVLLGTDSPCDASEIPTILSAALAMCNGVTTPCAETTSEASAPETTSETPEPTTTPESETSSTVASYPTETSTEAPAPTTTYAVGSTGLPLPTSTVPFTGAAAQATAAAGMVFAGAMAMLAAF